MQLRSQAVTIVITMAFLIIFIPTLFKREPKQLNKPLTIPYSPFPLTPDQLSLGLSNTDQSFKNLFKLPPGPAQAWVLQVADFKENSSAYAQVQSLRNKGFKAYMCQVIAATGTITRVFVGPEIKYEQIKKLEIQLNKAMQFKSNAVAFDPLLL